MSFRVALLQIESFGIDQSRNLEKGMEQCREAKSLGTDLVVFPELWNIGCARCPMDAAGRQAGGVGNRPAEQVLYKVRCTRQGARDKHRGHVSGSAFVQAPQLCIDHRLQRRRCSELFQGVHLRFRRGRVAKTCPESPGDWVRLHCSPGDSFDVCVLTGVEDQVTVGAMICADREFPEPATQLMLNGAELIVVPNACTWDEIRSAGLKTRALDNMVGMAMANYPGPQAGNSQAFTIAVRSTPSGGTVRPFPLATLWRRDRATISEVTAGFRRAHAREHPVGFEPDPSG